MTSSLAQLEVGDRAGRWTRPDDGGQQPRRLPGRAVQVLAVPCVRREGDRVRPSYDRSRTGRPDRACWSSTSDEQEARRQGWLPYRKA